MSDSMRACRHATFVGGQSVFLTYNYVRTHINHIFQLTSLKDKKRQRFRVIHLIEFIQSNNFHIYSIFNVSGLLRM